MNNVDLKDRKNIGSSGSENSKETKKQKQHKQQNLNVKNKVLPPNDKINNVGSLTNLSSANFLQNTTNANSAQNTPNTTSLINAQNTTNTVTNLNNTNNTVTNLSNTNNANNTQNTINAATNTNNSPILTPQDELMQISPNVAAPPSLNSAIESLENTEKLKKALSKPEMSRVYNASGNILPIQVETNTPNYSSKMLLAILQNRKNAMLEGKRVLCTEKIIAAEDVKRHTQGVIVVPKDQWINITPGSYILYMGFDDNYRSGGYIRYQHENNGRRYFQIETERGKKNNADKYMSFPLFYDEIKTLYKKIDPAAIIEITLIKKDLASKREQIDFVNRELGEEIKARVALERRVKFLEEENKKIKNLLKLVLSKVGDG